MRSRTLGPSWNFAAESSQRPEISQNSISRRTTSSWDRRGPLPPCLDLPLPRQLPSQEAVVCGILSSSEGILPHRPIVTLTTDFGTNDHFVGAVKGVIVDIVPDANIVDITHAVQAFDVLDGALAIAQTYSYFPTGTVHMIVV